jgi:hypothetical protein
MPSEPVLIAGAIVVIVVLAGGGPWLIKALRGKGGSSSNV